MFPHSTHGFWGLWLITSLHAASGNTSGQYRHTNDHATINAADVWASYGTLTWMYMTFDPGFTPTLAYRGSEKG
jgi:hypothetical protein